MKYSAIGMTRLQTSLAMDMDEKTLKKHYDNDIEKGKALAVGKVSGVLFRKATDDEDLGSIIWYLKTVGGWKEAKEDTNVNLNGSVNITHNIVGIEPDD